MTDVKKEIQEWISRVDDAIEVRNREKEDWEKNYRAVYGDNWIGPEDSRGRITARKAEKIYRYDKLLAFLKTEIPSLALTIPDVFLSITDEAEAKDPGKKKGLETIQNRLNTILSDLDGLDIDFRCMLADAYCALMVAKVVRVNRWLQNPMKGEIAYVDPLSGTPVPLPDEISEPAYDIIRVDPFRFLIDAEAKNNPRRALWQGEEFYPTLATIKADRMLDEEVLDKLESKIKKDGKYGDRKDWQIYLRMIEIWDRVEERAIVICEDYPDDYLRNDPFPEGIERSPYVIRKLCEIPGQFYGNPDVTSGRLMQDDIEQGREWQRDWARRSNPQLALKKTFVESSPLEAKRVMDGVSKWVVVNSHDDISMINKDIQGAQPSLEQHMAMCSRDFDETMGQSSMSRGLVGEAKFATEAEIAQLKGDQRQLDKQHQISMFFSQIVEKLLLLMETNKSEDADVIEAMDLINIDLDVEVSFENRSPRNKAIDRKQMIEAAQSFPALMNSMEFISQLLKTFDLRDINKILSEVSATMQAQSQAAQPQAKGMNLSLSLDHALLPAEAVDRIVDMIMNADIPITGGLPTNPKAAMGSPGEGLGKQAPGSGVLPSGEVI